MLTAFQIDAFQTCAFQEEAGAGVPREEEQPTGGWQTATKSDRPWQPFDFPRQSDEATRKERVRLGIIEEVVTKIAKKAVEVPVEARERQAVAELKEALQKEQVAWDKFYAELLMEQISMMVTQEIRAHFEMRGLIEKARLEQEEEDEAVAILTMMMDL
jgi:hypothetical protein